MEATATMSIPAYRASLLHRTRSRETPETLQKKAVRDYLTINRWWWYPNTAGFGVKKGIPDITAVKGGVVVQIEVKAPGGKQSKDQVDFMLDWRAHGGYYILGTIDDIIRSLKAIESGTNTGA